MADARLINSTDVGVTGLGRLKWQDKPRIVIVGASITAANNYSPTTTEANYGGHGWMNWANIRSGRRVQFETARDMQVSGSPMVGAIVAVSGYTSQQILDTLVPIAITRAPNIVIIENGGNDSDLTDAQALAVDIALEQAFLTRGIEVWRMPISPRTNSATSGAVLLQQRMRADAIKARSLVTPGLYWLDWRKPIVDPSLANGAPRADSVYDDRHLNTTGGFRVGKYIAAYIQARFPAFEDGVVMNDDVYNSATNPKGNAFVNPLVTGTGGNVGTSVTGVAADSYRAYRQTGVGSAVAALVARTDAWGALGNWGQMTITPDGTTGNGQFYYQQYIGGSSTISNPFPAGTWAQLEADVEVDAGFTGFREVNAVAQTLGGTTRTYRSMAAVSLLGNIPNEAWSGRLVTPPFEILADTTGIIAGGRVTIVNDGVGTGVVRWGSFSLRAVPDPRVTWPGAAI